LGDHGILAGNLPPIIENNHHNFFCGNHDNYQAVEKHRNYMGRFGSIYDGKVCFVSGGYSPDAVSRTAGFDWFYYEELNDDELKECWELIEKTQPVMMITHEPPDVLVDDLIAKNRYGCKFPRRPSRTGLFLNKLIQFPGIPSIKNWYFGHWHCNYETVVSGIHFKCIPMNGAWITHV
jgi:hypothetical protein